MRECSSNVLVLSWAIYFSPSYCCYCYNGNSYTWKDSLYIEKGPSVTKIARVMGTTWGPPGSCRPQMGPMLAPCTLLSGKCPCDGAIAWLVCGWYTGVVCQATYTGIISILLACRNIWINLELPFLGRESWIKEVPVTSQGHWNVFPSVLRSQDCWNNGFKWYNLSGPLK